MCTLNKTEGGQYGEQGLESSDAEIGVVMYLLLRSTEDSWQMNKHTDNQKDIKMREI